jgi:hypothetical protein
MDKIRNQKVARFLVLMIVAGIILWGQDRLSLAPQNERIAQIVTAVAVFACIPLLLKIWPVGVEKPPSMLKWSAFLIILSVGLLALNPPATWLLTLRHDHPRFAELVASLGSRFWGWPVITLVFLICLAARLRGTNATRRDIP